MQALADAWASSLPLPEVELKRDGQDRSLSLRPAVAGAGAIHVDYDDSCAAIWLTVGEHSIFELDDDLERLQSICGLIFRGEFRERIRRSDRRILESEGFLSGELATRHRCAWARSSGWWPLKGNRASTWVEIDYKPYEGHGVTS